MKAPYLRVGYFGVIVKDGVIPPDTHVYLDWNTKEVYYLLQDDEYAKAVSPSSFIFIDIVKHKAYKIGKRTSLLCYTFIFKDLLSLDTYEWDGMNYNHKLPQP